MIPLGILAAATPRVSGSGGVGTYVDDYVSPAGVWSAKKKLIRGYSGALIRIRRSSDNAEQDIGFDGTGNLDIAAVSAFVGSNSAYVTKIYRQFGVNASDLAQSTQSAQPRCVNAGVVESSIVKCDGSDDYLVAGVTGGLASSAATIFFDGDVSATNSNGEYGGAIDVFYNSGSDVGFAIYSESRTLTGTPGVVFAMSGSGSGPYMQRGFKDSDRGLRGANQLYCVRFDLAASAADNTSLHAFANGSDASQSTPASGNPNGSFNGQTVNVGRYAYGPYYNATGFKSLVLVASDALASQADILAVL